ncbi:MAG: glycoside hydrolase family 3 N-terminal domain-containing protein, partial [Phycisphaerae bacterium]|nr:glycoside hydrolase family 3 N-terminal domain-containing protein [Phycisphaerae bacterium]
GTGELSADIKRKMANGVGQLACILRDKNPGMGAEIANKVQKFLIEKTRLGIPAIIHDEALHGYVGPGSTCFPQSIALSSTWNPELVKDVAAAIGRETRSRGVTQVLSPTINIARDVRCGRTEETYGEDTHLTSRMAVAYVKGMQGEGVACTPKHLAANFVSDGGRDSYEVHLSERNLREVYLPVYEAAVREGGAWSILPGYHATDGVPASADKWLLIDVVRNEWNFKGIVVSDYGAVSGIRSRHKVVKTNAEAAKKAIEAGMDLEYPDVNCYAELVGLVRKGKLSEKVIDESTRRSLRVKFLLGLFDNPYTDPSRAEALNDAPAHRDLALDAARQAVVLLKNENVLPLKKNLKSIAILGPSARAMRLGGYSNRGCGIKVAAPLGSIRKAVSEKTKVCFAEGCKIKGGSKASFKKAVETAKKADVTVLFVGNSSSQPETAEVFFSPLSQNTEGESCDRTNLDLPGQQQDLIEAVAKTGTKVVVVLINGSAITMERWVDKVDGIIEAWYPGEEGGTAIAEVLFGDYNPGGRLPLTFPKRTGQVPLYYNHKPTGRIDDYADLRGKQEMFVFGHGLSYTKFDYTNLKIRKSKTKRGLQVKITLDVRNAGRRKGDEVVQLYIHDEYASLSRPVKELKRFKRITLTPAETQTVEFVLGKKDLSFLDINMKLVLEPGMFKVMVGTSSEDIRLEGGFAV